MKYPSHRPRCASTPQHPRTARAKPHELSPDHTTAFRLATTHSSRPDFTLHAPAGKPQFHENSRLPRLRARARSKCYYWHSAQNGLGSTESNNPPHRTALPSTDPRRSRVRTKCSLKANEHVMCAPPAVRVNCVNQAIAIPYAINVRYSPGMHRGYAVYAGGRQAQPKPDC
jgi:hypothetical protein